VPLRRADVGHRLDRLVLGAERAASWLGQCTDRVVARTHITSGLGLEHRVPLAVRSGLSQTVPETPAAWSRPDARGPILPESPPGAPLASLHDHSSEMDAPSWPRATTRDRGGNHYSPSTTWWGSTSSRRDTPSTVPVEGPRQLLLGRRRRQHNDDGRVVLPRAPRPRPRTSAIGLPSGAASRSPLPEPTVILGISPPGASRDDRGRGQATDGDRRWRHRGERCTPSRPPGGAMRSSSSAGGGAARATVRNFGLVWVSGRAAGRELRSPPGALPALGGDRRPRPGHRLSRQASLTVAQQSGGARRGSAELPDATERFELLSAEAARRTKPALTTTVARASPGVCARGAPSSRLSSGCCQWLAEAAATASSPDARSSTSPTVCRRFDRRGHGADRVVLCCGAWHSGVLGEILADAPLRGVRLQMLETERYAPELTTSLADGGLPALLPGLP